MEMWKWRARETSTDLHTKVRARLCVAGFVCVVWNIKNENINIKPYSRFCALKWRITLSVSTPDFDIESVKRWQQQQREQCKDETRQRWPRRQKLIFYATPIWAFRLRKTFLNSNITHEMWSFLGAVPNVPAATTILVHGYLSYTTNCYSGNCYDSLLCIWLARRSLCVTRLLLAHWCNCRPWFRALCICQWRSINKYKYKYKMVGPHVTQW